MSLTEVAHAPASEHFGASAPLPPKGAVSAAPTSSSEPWKVNSYFVILVHIVGTLAILFYRPAWQTLLMTFITFSLGALGITMGYHRLWSHRSYTASLPLRIFLAFCGTLAFQASIKWWVLRHRLHHRFTDTEHDPYDSTKGFYFSHIGWIFQKPHYPRMRSIDISDLRDDPVVCFQHKYYVPLAMTAGFVLPTVVASTWGDTLGGFLWGGYVSRMAVWHATFLINSYAHWGGDQPFATGVSARGNLLLAMLTMGEGYHNFHHEFPKDYRNGINFWDWDPTKWSIKLCSWLGLASGLYQVPPEEIDKAKISVKETELERKRRRYKWGPTDDELPVMTREEFAQMVRDDPSGRQWVLVDGYALDTEEYASSHPGGAKVLQSFRGKDASHPFNGGMNLHTTAARSMAKMLRVARVVDAKEE